MNRAGKRAVTPDLAIDHLAGLQRLPQPVEHVAAELGRLVEEQAPVVRQSDAAPGRMTPLPPPTIAALVAV